MVIIVIEGRITAGPSEIQHNNYKRKGIWIMFGLVPFNTRNDIMMRDDEFSRLFDWMNRPLMSLFQDAGFSGSAFKVDVKDNDTNYELTAELPGVTKDDISLTYKDNYLTVATKQEHTKDEKDENGSYIRRERYSGSMSRSFYIDNIDETKLDAEFKDGVLRVILPKADAPKEEPLKEIPIRAV